MTINRQFRLAARPVGMPRATDWQQTEEPLAPLKEGYVTFPGVWECVLRGLYDVFSHIVAAGTDARADHGDYVGWVAGVVVLHGFYGVLCDAPYGAFPARVHEADGALRG